MVTFFFVEKSEIKTKNGTQRVTLNSSVQILLDMTVRKKTDLMIKKNILLDCNSSKFNNKNCSSMLEKMLVNSFVVKKNLYRWKVGLERRVEGGQKKGM